MAVHTVGFVGLGIMGGPMAANLVRAGFDVVGHNRSRGKVERLIAAGGRGADSAADAARDRDVVISMLPDGAVKLKVYVPEASFSSVAVGGHLAVRCDGCPPGLRARISYVSPDPEFTPPVIYSLETRQKLVYLVEARPEGDASPLKPGQIVDVDLASRP